MVNIKPSSNILLFIQNPTKVMPVFQAAVLKRRTNL